MNLKPALDEIGNPVASPIPEKGSERLQAQPQEQTTRASTSRPGDACILTSNTIDTRPNQASSYAAPVPYLPVLARAAIDRNRCRLPLQSPELRSRARTHGPGNVPAAPLSSGCRCRQILRTRARHLECRGPDPLRDPTLAGRLPVRVAGLRRASES